MAEGTVAERWFERPHVEFDAEADRLRRVAVFEAWMAREPRAAVGSEVSA